MKRIISITMAFIIACSFLHTTAFAASKAKPEITVSSVSSAAGEKVKVNISLKNNPGIISACINVAFDSGLTLTEVKNGNAFPASLQFTKPKQLANGGQIKENCNFVWSGADIADKDIKDGVILTLTFSVSSKAETGDAYGITVSSRKSDVIDKNLNCVQIETAIGKVSVVNNASDNAEGTSIGFLIEWLRNVIRRLKDILLKII